MAAKKENKESKELVVTANSSLDQALMANIPTEPSYTENQFPRISFVAKDVTEEVKNKKTGKKEINIITEAGTFVREVYNTETKEFDKTELGKSIDVTFVFERRQLRHYDPDKGYTSSPIYDADDEIIPLFNNKKVVDRGTAEELRSRPEYVEVKNDKKRITLEEQKVCYVIYEGEMHQLTIRGSSSWAFSKYKKTVPIPLVVTTLDSTEEENGSVTYNKMTFEVARELEDDEKKEVLDYQTEIKDAIAAKKEYFDKFKVGDEAGNDDDDDDDVDDPDFEDTRTDAQRKADGEFEVKPRGMSQKEIKKLGGGKKGDGHF